MRKGALLIIGLVFIAGGIACGYASLGKAREALSVKQHADPAVRRTEEAFVNPLRAKQKANENTGLVLLQVSGVLGYLVAAAGVFLIGRYIYMVLLMRILNDYMVQHSKPENIPVNRSKLCKTDGHLKKQNDS
jgi:hypothetical protein